MQKRKSLRLPAYDYSQNGVYFITICTEGKKHIFGRVVGGGVLDAPHVCLSDRGNIAEQTLLEMNDFYGDISIDKYVVMPNHVHLLLQAHACEAAGHVGPALQDVVRWYKTMTTNAFIRVVKAGEMPPFDKTVWQASFYDEVIRGQDHYLRAWQYIDDNPAHWAEDEYYSD